MYLYNSSSLLPFKPTMAPHSRRQSSPLHFLGVGIYDSPSKASMLPASASSSPPSPWSPLFSPNHATGSGFFFASEPSPSQLWQPSPGSIEFVQKYTFNGRSLATRRQQDIEMGNVRPLGLRPVISRKKSQSRLRALSPELLRTEMLVPVNVCE